MADAFNRVRVADSRMLALGLLAIAALLACGGGEDDEVEVELPVRVQRDGSIRIKDTERQALGLRCEPAAVAELGNTELSFGRVEARQQDQAVAVAPVAGRIAGPAAVALGARVEAGAAIAELTPVLATAERLSANVRGAELSGQIDALSREVAARQAELARAEQLASAQIVSAAKLQEARTALAASRAQLDALRNARGIQSRAEGSAITVRAPLGGVIASLDAEVGALVSAGAVVARVLQPGALWVDVQVAPDAVPGDRYAVQAGGRWLPAQLLASGALLAADGFRHDRIEVSAAEAPLLPGATVRVRIGHATERGVVVPDSALIPHPGGAALFVEQAKGSFVRREVVVAARSDDKVRLASGVAAGEAVVVRGARALQGESLRALLSERD